MWFVRELDTDVTTFFDLCLNYRYVCYFHFFLTLLEVNAGVFEC